MTDRAAQNLAKIEMRLVHNFEMRDGQISRELVFDMGRVR